MHADAGIRAAVPAFPAPLAALVAWAALGCAGMYAYVALGERDGAAAGTALLLGALTMAICCLVISNERKAAYGAAALVFGIAVVTAVLPSMGSAFVDSVILLTLMVAATVSFARAVRMPAVKRVRLRNLSLAVVLFLPIVMAFAEAAALGLRFWESFPLGTPSYLFVPFMAIWGFAEEALFRGTVQRSFAGVMGPSAAIASATVLNAAYMLFWGSVMYAAFSFLAALLFGALYHRSGSVVYVGTLRALMDTWLIIAFIALGLTSP